jgi:hypothetical protein
MAARRQVLARGSPCSRRAFSTGEVNRGGVPVLCARPRGGGGQEGEEGDAPDEMRPQLFPRAWFVAQRRLVDCGSTVARGLRPDGGAWTAARRRRVDCGPTAARGLRPGHLAALRPYLHKHLRCPGTSVFPIQIVRKKEICTSVFLIQIV